MWSVLHHAQGSTGRNRVRTPASPFLGALAMRGMNRCTVRGSNRKGRTAVCPTATVNPRFSSCRACCITVALVPVNASPLHSTSIVHVDQSHSDINHIAMRSTCSGTHGVRHLHTRKLYWLRIDSIRSRLYGIVLYILLESIG